MNKTLEVFGEVISVLGNNNYKVLATVGNTQKVVDCHLSGRMRRYRITVIVGDQVQLEIPPPYDKGRIIFREK